MFVFLSIGLQNRIYLFITALGTSTPYRKFDRLSFEIRKLGRLFKYSAGEGEIKIDNSSAVIAHRVVVSRQIAVVSVSSRAELDLADQALTLQKAQRIVNGCE
jgi:hypothetical protein